MDKPQRWNRRKKAASIDYFGARYLSAAQGRFSSLDPLLLSAKLEDPQTWNRYVYARNNPLRYNDRTGLYPSPAYNCSDTEKDCLNPEQRRIPENSTVKDKNGNTLSGEALYKSLSEKQRKGGTTLKFTGKERNDSMTRLDYFGARYYSRFRQVP